MINPMQWLLLATVIPQSRSPINHSHNIQWLYKQVLPTPVVERLPVHQKCNGCPKTATLYRSQHESCRPLKTRPQEGSWGAFL